MRVLRPAFSVVELLVVVAIIGVLVGMLLPAVQAARESARRSACGNNLRQLGVGMALHESVARRFPAGYVSDSGRSPVDAATLDRPPGTGWGMLIAPYLEETALQQAYDPAAGVAGLANRSIVSNAPVVFRCPSDAGPRDAFAVSGPGGGPHPSGAVLGRSSYVGNAGREEPWSIPRESWEGVADGPLYRNSWLSMRRISDGLSGTVFLGEHSQRVSQKAWAGTVTGARCQPGERFLAMTGVEADAAATLLLVHSGPSAVENDVIHPPNDPAAHVCQMYADHPRGCNVAFGDASVRFVADSINHDVWAGLSSFDGGESVRADDR